MRVPHKPDGNAHVGAARKYRLLPVLTNGALLGALVATLTLLVSPALETSTQVFAAEKSTKKQTSNKRTQKQARKQPRKHLGRNADAAAWKKVRQVSSCAAYHHYLRTFPRGRYKSAAFKALRSCRRPGPRWRYSVRNYYSYYPPYIDPIWPWVLIPEPPVVIVPPEEIIPPEVIDPEPVHPIAPEPDYPDAVTLPSPDPMPDIGAGGFDGGFDGGVDGGFDGGFDSDF